MIFIRQKLFYSILKDGNIVLVLQDPNLVIAQTFNELPVFRSFIHIADTNEILMM